MKTQLLACLFALFSVLVLAQDENLAGRGDLIRTYGTGVVLVPVDRAAITITASGIDATASDAVRSAQDLQSNINDTLRNFTVFDVRSGGLYLAPLYTGSVLSFVARVSLSVVIPANETARVIDSMINLGASNISFLFTPDFRAVETAQRQALQLAVADGLFKAQSVLDTVNRCALNISAIAIRNPALELPTLTFNIFANMGGRSRFESFLGGRNNLQNIEQPGSEMDPLSGENIDRDDLESLRRYESYPAMLGAGSPFAEGGDREEVVAYVELWLSHTNCEAEGAVRNLASGLDLSNIVGISGGTFREAAGSPVAPPPTPAEGSPMPGGSPIGEGTGMNQRRRMW